MTGNEARVPAWRRLGLALKNEAQSGVTAPDGSKGSQDKIQSPIVPAVNGKSSKLGKRKHQHEPAEVDGGQSLKRGKTSSADYESGETTNPDVVAEVDNATSDAGPSGLPLSEASRPKGDPNYRKKKEKPKNRKRRNDGDAEHDSASKPDRLMFEEPVPAQTEANLGHSSLSPDASSLTLLASTETSLEALPPATTPQQRESRRSTTKDTSGSPSGVDRRKSVAFTPDTKKVDGNSAQNLFKKWVAEQKGTEEKAKTSAYEDTSLSGTATATHTHSEDHSGKQSGASSKSTTTTKAVPKGKKKDPSIYLSYLTQYHTDRKHWKFNKTRQNDVIDNALNIFRIPQGYSDALQEYVSGLKGAGVVQGLKEKANATLKELDEEDAKESTIMDDAAARETVQSVALQERISKEQMRRKVEGDVEALLHHPHGDGYLRRLRRERAVALLAALSRTAPILPATQTNGINPMLKNVAPPKRDSRKKKRRADVSSDESSSSESSSSSEEESSSDSDSESGSSKASSSASASSSSGGSGSESGRNQVDDSESDGESD